MWLLVQHFVKTCCITGVLKIILEAIPSRRACLGHVTAVHTGDARVMFTNPEGLERRSCLTELSLVTAGNMVKAEALTI